MRRNGDRDRSVDRMLRQTQRGPRTSVDAPGGCVDAETVAAWSEGVLPASAAALVETHLSQCARCQALLATFARSAPDTVLAESLWRRWRLQWLVPIAATATAVAVWIAMPTDRRTASSPQFDARLEAPAESPQAAPPTTAPASPPARASREGADRDSPPDAPKAVAEPVSRLDVEANASSRGSIAQEARAAGDEITGAGREADLASRDRSAAANQALAEEARPASPSRPAAASVPGERRELAVQRQAGAPIEIVSPNPANRWRIVASARVERSTTGGNTWAAAAIASPAELTAGSSPDPLVCWLVGLAGVVRLTVDGVRFQGVPFPETVDLVDVRAESARSALVTAADGRRFRTDDQGIAWSRVTP